MSSLYRRSLGDLQAIQRAKSTVQADARDADKAHNRPTGPPNLHPKSDMSKERLSLGLGMNSQFYFIEVSTHAPQAQTCYSDIGDPGGRTLEGGEDGGEWF